MKVKIIKASRETFWYSGSMDTEDCMIGKIRNVRWGTPRMSFKRYPWKWIKASFRIEDTEKSEVHGVGWLYKWADVKIVSWF